MGFLNIVLGILLVLGGFSCLFTPIMTFINAGYLLIILFFAILLGAVTGTVIWAFLRSVGIGTNLLWERLPEKFDIRGYRIVVCTVGGLIIGIFRKVFGAYRRDRRLVLLGRGQYQIR